MNAISTIPPNCFSALAGLNQCFDEIKAMQDILVKVICDLAATNPDFQKCLADGIAASGSSLPTLGVTNGSPAPPGQVGEFISTTQAVPVTTALTHQFLQGAILQPGDWDVWAWASAPATATSMAFLLSPTPTGLSNNMTGELNNPTTIAGATAIGITARALISVPTLLVFDFAAQFPVAANATFSLEARRRR